MRHYLRRKDTLDSYSARFVLPRGFYSEQFLHAALDKRATSHIHRDWMFCKMGRVSLNRTKQSAIDWWRSMLTQTARRIRSARTGYAFCCASASCACGAYQRRRAACPKAARLLYCTLRTRTSLGRATCTACTVAPQVAVLPKCLARMLHAMGGQGRV